MAKTKKDRYRTSDGNLVTKKTKVKEGEATTKYKTITPRKVVEKEKYTTKSTGRGQQETTLKKKVKNANNKYTKKWENRGVSGDVYEQTKRGALKSTRNGVEKSVSPTGLKFKDKSEKVYDRIEKRKGFVTKEEMENKKSIKTSGWKKSLKKKKKYPLQSKDIKPVVGKEDYRGMF